LWLSALGRPDWIVVWIFVLGTVLMRSAGCVINDYADRDFDGTSSAPQRPLTAGKVTTREALGCSPLCCCPSCWCCARHAARHLAVAAGCLPGRQLSLHQAFLAIPQAYLGIAFGFGIPMAYAAHLDGVPAEAWWLLLANVFWAVAYDTEYAMVDRNDDLKIGIKTSAITFGRFDVAAVMCATPPPWPSSAGWAIPASRLGLLRRAGLAAGIMGVHYTWIRAANGCRASRPSCTTTGSVPRFSPASSSIF
jgi:4-hydroxybenzoate polyprenyltransferase